MEDSMNNFASIGHRVHTLEELSEIAPAVFATEPAKGVTDRYNFVSTEQMVKDILDLGWELHAAKQTSKTNNYGRHLVRFTHPKMGYIKTINRDNVKPQIILDNSHNRASSAQLHMGLFRLVCSNGLVVAIPGMYSNVKFRHMGIDKEELKQVLNKAAEQYGLIGEHVADMQEVKMLVDQQEEFAIKAMAAREPHMFIKEDGTIDVKKVTASTNPKEIITPIRGEDKPNNLWTTFNVIQERMLKGGYQRISGSGRNSTTKGVSSAARSVDLNRTLWGIAEEYMPETENKELVLAN